MHARIADAAVDVLAERGWHRFSREAVATAAGVSNNAVYGHYDTKLTLALDAIRQLPVWAGTTIGDGDPYQRLLQLVTIGDAYPHRFLPILTTALHHQDEVPELLQTLTDHVIAPRIAAYDTLLAEGRAAGWADLHVTGWQIDAAFTGLLVAEMRGDPLLNGPHRNTAIANMIWELARDKPSTHTPPH